jgi:hypothetical protein
MSNAHGSHKKRNAYRVLARNPKRKRSIRIPSRRWEDNIIMDLREIGWGGMGRINLAQDRNQR